MGGGHSVENITQNINETIVNVTIDSIQKQDTTVLQLQSLTLDCRDPVLLAAMDVCRKDFLASAEKNKWSFDQLDKLLKNCPGCEATNISMKGAISLNLDSKQLAKASTEIETKLLTDLKQKAQQENSGILEFDNKLVNKITNISRIVASQTVNIYQNSVVNNTQKSTIDVKGGRVSFVTFDLVNNSVLKYLQQNDVISKQVSELATQISQDAKQLSGGGILKWVIIIICIILGLLLILGITLWIIKRNRDNKTKEAVSDASTITPSITASRGRGRRRPASK